MAENEIMIKSNWICYEGASLNSMLMKNTSNNAGINIEDCVANNYVCLKPGDCKDKPYLEIKVNGFIKRIGLLSQAYVIDVFGSNDEYLSTHTAVYYDHFYPSCGPLYYSKICLPNIPVCKLKFLHTHSKEELSIYGARIQVDSEVKHKTESLVSLNCDQISRPLSNSSIPHKSKTNYFKNILHYFIIFQKVIMEFILGKSSFINEIQKVPKEKIMENMAAGMLFRSLVSDSHSQNGASRSCNNKCLKTYIDEKVREIKTEIFHEIEGTINSLRGEINIKSYNFSCSAKT